MSGSLLDAWWTRWAILACGAGLIWWAWSGTDEGFRETHKIDEDDFLSPERRDSLLQGGLNRLFTFLLGVGMVLVGLFWGKVGQFVLGLFR